ncbi:hypothetical protein ACFYXH_36020 [Streptomyces sp. NPDC002730]|uniref:hypothetical protein n=1 Tax=Streptomyces sp. NPDC002730 TaxID=3364662 RepID=UPI0036A10AD9
MLDDPLTEDEVSFAEREFGVVFPVTDEPLAGLPAPVRPHQLPGLYAFTSPQHRVSALYATLSRKMRTTMHSR